MKLIISILLSAIVSAIAGFVVFATTEAIIRGADPTDTGYLIGIIVFWMTFYKISDRIYKWIKKRF